MVNIQTSWNIFTHISLWSLRFISSLVVLHSGIFFSLSSFLSHLLYSEVFIYPCYWSTAEATGLFSCCWGGRNASERLYSRPSYGSSLCVCMCVCVFEHDDQWTGNSQGWSAAAHVYVHHMCVFVCLDARLNMFKVERCWDSIWTELNVLLLCFGESSTEAVFSSNCFSSCRASLHLCNPALIFEAHTKKEVFALCHKFISKM